MSQNVPKMRQKLRQAYISKNILFESQEELAKACGVDRKTIQRDIQKWKQDGGFANFLNKEFFELYSKEKITKPSKALDRVMYLMSKYEVQVKKRVHNASIKRLLHKYRTVIETEETITELNID
jgi:biotin operon repressor